jgi:type VI secretion system secreted protein VgrG
LDRGKGDTKKAKTTNKTPTKTNKGVPKVKQPKPTEKVDNKKKKEYGENDGGVGPKTTDVLKSPAANPNSSSSHKSSGSNKTDSPIKDSEDVIDKSPTLKIDIKQLEKDGWDIKYGEAGKGSYADRETLEIVIDESEKGNAGRIVQTLAHEKGHALYKVDPYVPPTGLTKENYVKENVKRHLKDEGEATLSNLEVRDEILSCGGPDIGVGGTKAKQYEHAYKEYRSIGDREKAREVIGDFFADGERPSTNPDMNYREYYSKPYEDFYDNTIANKKKP